MTGQPASPVDLAAWEAACTASAPTARQIEAARHARTIKRKPQSDDLGPLFDPIQPGLFG
jgi:hypothetical protein